MNEVQARRKAARREISIKQLEAVLGKGFKFSTYDKDDTLSSSWTRSVTNCMLGRLKQEIAYDDNDGWIAMLWSSDMDFHREAKLGRISAAEAIQGLVNLTEAFRTELLDLAVTILPLKSNIL